jgi:Na+/melibiose symporter-like transporter
LTAYGFAHFGKSLLWHASELLFAFYLTEICHLGATQMGVVLSMSLLASAICDAITGQVLTTRMRATPAAVKLQVVGATLAAVSFTAFALVALAPPAWRLAGVGLTLLGFRLVYSLYDLPQNAILAFETADDAQRSGLSALRLVLSGVANLVIAGSFIPLVGAGAAATQPWRFCAFAVGLSLVAMVSGVNLSRVVGGRSGTGAPPPAPAPMAPSIATPWRLMLAGLLVSLCTSVFSRLEPYLASYGLATQGDGACLMISVSLGTLLSQPIWAALVARTGLLRAQWMAALILALGAVIVLLFARQGTVWAMGGGLAYGAGFGGVLMILWACLARASVRAGDIIRQFGLFTFFSKLGLALSALATGWAMSHFDYRSSATTLTAAMTLVPMAGAFLACVLTMRVASKG